MLIKGIQKTTLVDYPGKVASTIFLYGCNFRCPFCFSPELVLEEKSPTKNFSQGEILSLLEKRKKYIEGVCITGGEPTLNKELPDFIMDVRNLGLLVKLDTNGTNPDLLERMLIKGILDYVAMDIKAPLEKYEAAAGVKMNLNTIKKSTELLKNSGIDYEFRTTIIPRLHGRDDILSICSWLKGSKKYCLQQFRPFKTLDKEFKSEKPYTSKQMQAIADMARPFFDVCEVRNL
jgi:pyruvate formate lyase activating enzyme